MATQRHTHIPLGALISIALALAIGSVPVVTLLALQQSLSSAGLGQ